MRSITATQPEPPVVIVSGWPRSGTSLAMQMLAAGGAPLLVDDVRTSDEHNPRGYWELAAVKSLRHDARWVAQAARRGVKVVAPLLRDLPSGFTYYVIYMMRDWAEVAASQQAMLAQHEMPPSALVAGGDLAALLAREEERLAAWLSKRLQFRVLRLSFAEAIAAPGFAAEQMAEFLQGVWPDLRQNVNAMAAAVEPQLHRQRAAT